MSIQSNESKANLAVQGADPRQVSALKRHQSIVSEEKEMPRPSWQTGAANDLRKKNNMSDKKNGKKNANSKKLVGTLEQESVIERDVRREVEESKDVVVHPWHLSFVKHRWVDEQRVIVDSKDHQGVFTVASHADNISGSGLVRTVKGVGHVRLPLVWGNLEYVRKACDPLAGESLGKLDLDLKYLVPRALVNLRQWINPWPGAEKEIAEYLGSVSFSQLVVDHYKNRLGRVQTLLRAKCLRFAAKLNATEKDVNNALMLYNNPWKWAGLLMGLYLVLVALVGLGCYLAYKGKMGACMGVLSACAGVYRAIAWFNFNDKVRRIYFELWSESFAISYGSVVEIMSTCSKGIHLPALLDTWKFTLREGVQDMPCKVKRAYDSFGTWIAGANMVVPNACHHDQFNGLAIRYFFERVIDKCKISQCIDNAKSFFHGYSMKGAFKLYSYDEWVSHLTGRRRSMLMGEPAAVNVADYTNVDIFVKLEAYLGKNPMAFKPRIIQGRTLGYFNIVGAFFYSVSKWLGDCFSEKNGNFIYDSGLDAKELGRLATRMFSEYKYVYEIDVSNWDGSLVPQWLKFEIWFIDNVLPMLPPRWKELKRHWCTVRGSGKHGVGYQTTHGRRSGDMWTSAFNSLINLLILHWIFGWDVLAIAKGDDNFFGTNSNLSLDDIVAKYSSIGMKAKVKRVDHISRLGYCSGTFYQIEDGSWKWGVKPFRILSKFGLNLNRHPRKLHDRLLYGTAVSMLPIGAHVPVLGPLLETIVESGKRRNISPLLPTKIEEWRTTSDSVDHISASGYEIVASNYGFSLEQMDRMEWQCQYHTTEPRPLQLSDFPIVFEENDFLKGFAADVDLDVVPDTSNITISRKLSDRVNWPHIFNVLLLSPLLEELVRSLCILPMSALIGLVEWYLSDRFLQFVLHMAFGLIAMTFGSTVSWLTHVLWNFYIMLSRGDGHQRDRREVGYGSLYSWLLGVRDTLSRRRSGVFTLTLDRVDLDKYRLASITAPLWRSWWTSHQSKESTKNSSQKNKPAKKAGSKPSKKKGSLGRNLLKGGLGAVGSMFGPVAAGIGASLGDWGANILGMGDYEVKHNTILEGNGVPTMHMTKRGVVISHREFLGDITGSTGFVSRDYVINPGSSKTFPWLSNIACMFQTYRIKGLIFEFNSTSADALNSVNTALGTVIMSTQYNVALPPFLNKAEMEQYEYTVSGRPSRNLTHCVECDPSLQVMSHLYTRTGVLPAGQDYQFYDWGRFQLATVGMQAAATIGELWVSYEVEFLKPRIASGGAWPGDFTRISNGPYSVASNVLGDIQVNPVGNLGVTISAGASGFQRITFPNNISAGRFVVTVWWKGTVGAAITAPSRTYSNLTVQPNFSLGAVSDFTSPGNGGTSTGLQQTVIVTVNGYSDAGSYIEYGVAGTLPTTPVSVDILVVALPLSDTGF